jgi:hypothetical protein
MLPARVPDVWFDTAAKESSRDDFQPSLCFGASGAAMHGFNEYVDLDSLKKSTKATALFIAEWCGVKKAQGSPFS